MKTARIALLFFMLAAFAMRARAGETYQPKWESLDRRPVPQWFTDAKFGVFIHWGVYSVPAWAMKGEYSEWYWYRIADMEGKKHPWKDDGPWKAFHAENYGARFDYKDFAPRFTAELFDAAHWADVFARAGVKYVVPTSKHHDGFALWPSAEASCSWGRPWNAMETGPKRDLLGELAAATRERGLKFGFYYSLYEWFNPLWSKPAPERFINEHMIPQFKDVVMRYQPSIIFSDGEWDLPSEKWRTEELIAWLYNETPVRDEVVVNDRWGKDCRGKHGGYFTTEYAAGMKDGSHAWEENRGMGMSYGYNRAERAEDYKSARELLLILIDTVSRGGNLLLDIGPAADGTIPPIMEERLLEMGEWLRVNGEAIYGTHPAGRACQWTDGKRPEHAEGEFRVKYEIFELSGQKKRADGMAVKQVFYTQKTDALHVITAGWPGEKLFLKDVTVPRDAKVTMFGMPGALEISRKPDGVEIEMPDAGPDSLPCRHAYVIKIPGGSVAAEQLAASQ